MLSKTVHLRPLRSSHIIRVKSPERAALICDRNSIIESDFEYKPILKTSFDSKIYKFQKDRMSNPPNINDTKQYHTEGSHINDTDSAVCHTVDYFVQKKKRYNQQVKDVQNVPLSRVVSQEEFKALRSTSNGLSHSPPPKRGEEADQRNIYRRNFYVSKPFAQINKDFKSLVPNAQTTSEDTPHWFQGTTQYYDQDNLDQAKKLRKSQSGVSKTDIFGKPNIKPSQADYPFFAQPPSKGQRYELNRMVIAERRTEKDYDSRVPHVQLKWEEKPQNQSYDRVKMTNKIGKNGQPFIKDLEAKRAFDPMITYKKIGEFQEAQRIKQEKPMELKIGHPNDQYIHAKRKAREDGFYGNRKEIAGENYQRSSFFV